MQVQNHIIKDMIIVLSTAVFFITIAIFAFKKFYSEKKKVALFLLLSIPCFAGFFIFIQPILLEDNLSYTSYVRTMFMDNNLDIWNEYFLLNSYNIYTHDSRLPIGPTGCAIFLAPFFFAGHVLALFLNQIGFSYPLDGFTFPYIFTLAIGGFFYCLFSLFLIFDICRSYFSKGLCLFSTFFIFFGTNLFMVAYMWTGSTYPSSLLMFSLFLFIWHKTREKRDIFQWIILGIAGGLMIQIRFQNALLLIIPALEWIKLAIILLKTRKWAMSGHHFFCGLTFLFCVMAGFSPQLIAWKAINGSFLIDLYDAGTGTFDSPVMFNMMHMLFSTDIRDFPHTSGLLAAMPVLIPVMAGFLFFFKKDREFAIYMCVAIILQLLVVASYDDWHGNLLFASAYFITCSPFFVLGLCAFLEKLKPLKVYLLMKILLCIACIWNIRCILIQQIFEQVTYYPENFSFLEGLHKLIFLPDLKIDEIMMKLSGNSFYFVREFVQFIKFGKISALAEPLFFFLLSIAGFCCLIFITLTISKLKNKWKEKRFSLAVIILCLSIISLINISVINAGLNTDIDYDYYNYDNILDSYELKFEKTGYKKLPLTIQIDEPMVSDSVYLIGFLTDSHELRQEEAVAEVFITDANASVIRYTMKAGIDTADYAIDHPEAVSQRMHTAEDAKIVHNWLIRDKSTLYYYGHAYLCRIKLASPREIRSVRIEYRAKTGDFALTHLRILQNVCL